MRSALACELGHAREISRLVLHQVGPAVRIEGDRRGRARVRDQGSGLGRALVVDQRGRADMEGFDGRERNGAAPVGPVPRRGLGIVEGVVRLAGDDANEGERRLVVAAGGERELDVGCGGVVGDHAPEHIGRDAADKSGRRAQPRHADRDIEAGAADRRHHRFAPVGVSRRDEIDQRIAAGKSTSVSTSRRRSRIAARLPRSTSRSSL